MILTKEEDRHTIPYNMLVLWMFYFQKQPKFKDCFVFFMAFPAGIEPAIWP